MPRKKNHPMQNYDWSRFAKKIPVQISIPELYKAWATRAGLESWFLRMAAFTAPDGRPRAADTMLENGDTYKWAWHGWPDEVMEEGRVLEANGKDLFRFSFGKAGDVTVRLSVEEGISMVTLIQENIPTDEESKVRYHIGCTEGWIFYLTNLKSILEGGVDLRNRNVHLQLVINS